VTKEYVLGVTDYSKATWGQNFIASIAGAVASITVAAPLDTVKTRIQNANFERKVHGITVIKELVKNEGPTAFFKGLTPKVRTTALQAFLLSVKLPLLFFLCSNLSFFFLQILVVGPKLVFSYTLAQSLIPLFSKYV